MHHASIIPIDPVRDSIHFNPRARSLDDRNDMESSSENGQPTLESTHALNMSVDLHSIDINAVVLQAQAMGLQRIQLAAVAQFMSSTDLAAHLWAAACRGSIELGVLQVQVGFVSIDGRVQQRYVAVLAGEMIAIRCQAVEPSNIDFPLLHLGK